MRRIVIKEARPGMVVARAVRHPAEASTILAASGESLTVDPIVNFHETGIYDLWVTEPGLEFLDDICSSQPTNAQMRLADGLRTSFLRFCNAAVPGKFKRQEMMIEDCFRSLIKAAPGVPCFQALTEDEILLAHSCDVAVISILLGLNLEQYLIEQRRRLNTKQARDVLNLALGALFHDIGETMLPAQQRESFSGRDPAADAWRQHTDEGYGIVRGHLDPSAAIIVQHHHQHFDGSGFAGASTPGGPARQQAGSSIHVYARIVMAAEVFCLTHFAGGRIPQPMIKTLWQLQQAPVRAMFDPTVYQCLLQFFPPFVEGMVVMLNDNRQAVIRKANLESPCYPAVSVVHGEGFEGDEVINIGEDKIFISIVDGTPIEAFLYGTPKHRPLVAA
jgi:HD-GYP domain-containing protein (c-di-GMP phosphodiesterase class II)